MAEWVAHDLKVVGSNPAWLFFSKLKLYCLLQHMVINVTEKGSNRKAVVAMSRKREVTGSTNLLLMEQDL